MGKFNKIVGDCVKNLEMLNNKNRKYHYNSKEEYNETLKEQLKGFTLTAAEKKSIDCIVYNDHNSDGTFSAAIVYHYLTSEKKSPQLFRIGAGDKNLYKYQYKNKNKCKIIDKLDDKVVLFLDLEYKENIYKILSEKCKKVFTIDDHKTPEVAELKNVKLISSNNGHGTIALVWKIFYPKKEMPKIVMMIDSKDSFKLAKFLPYASFIATAMSFRFMASPYISRDKWSTGEPLNDIWNVIENDNNQLWTVIGSYMHEVEENIKEQIARNAVVRNFQGYRVGVLNFSDPVLTKRIARQINSNLRGQIDFAVLWAYEHNKNLYRIQLIDDHHQTKINLENIARKLGKIGDTGMGGGGHGYHVGNFYWPRTNDKDIWDLFTKKYI